MKVVILPNVLQILIGTSPVACTVVIYTITPPHVPLLGETITQSTVISAADSKGQPVN